MSTSRTTTKSPAALAKMALKVARRSLEPYSSRRSRHDFTQPQLFAILALRKFFDTDYRGIMHYLHDFAELRKLLGLTKIPHWTTLQKAEARLLKKGLWSVFCNKYVFKPAVAA